MLKDRVAIVTGAGRGVGRAVALELLCAGEGAKVVVNDPGVSLQGAPTDERPADEVVREIRSHGGEAVASYDSVAGFASAEHIVRAAHDRFGRLDVLVNNAGIIRDRTLFKMTEDDFDAVLAVHLKGTFNMCRHAAPVMRDKGYGRIINMTSAAGLKGNFGQTNYSAAKAGIIGLTMTLALELEKYGITVNAFAPRATTRMTGAIPAARDPVKNRGDEIHRLRSSGSCQRSRPQVQRGSGDLDGARVDVDAVEVVLQDRLDDRLVAPLRALGLATMARLLLVEVKQQFEVKGTQ